MNFGEESEFVEFKESTAEISEALEAMSGILNEHGSGTIYFGVKDNGEAIGFPCGRNTENDILRRIALKIDPAPIVETVLTRIFDGNKGIIEVRFSGNRPPYQYNGRYYMRNGREDDPMSAAELEQYVLARRKDYTSWENSAGDQAISDLSESLIERVYSQNPEIKREYPEYPGVEKTLRFFGLLTKQGQPNNAAVALFGRRPLTLKTATFRYFDQSEAEDMNVVKGNVIELIRHSEDYILSHIGVSYEIIGNLERRNVPEIPREAIREILVNAFAHADYSSNTSHQVFVYRDRVSIYNPGYFPIGLKPEDYAEGGIDPVERNPKIYDVLHTLGYVETYATGLRKTFHVCMESKTTIGYEQTIQGGFRFEFFRKGETIYPPFADGESDEEKILSLLVRNSFMKIDEIAHRIGRGKITAYAKLHSLVDQGKVKRIGSDKTGYWIVTRR